MKKENLNITKEKMIIKCKKIGNVMEVAFWLVIIMLIIAGIASLIGICSEGLSAIEIIYETLRDKFNIGTEFSEIDAIKETIISIAITILNLIILYSLSKVFTNTAKDETPFSMNNVKNLKKISICAYIVFFITIFSQIHSLGLIYVLAIAGIEYIFRYGYKLQLESDETL